ncbi:MAG: aminotransferase class I/II-fold pyridoxal phosphate-dependent enzyme [Chloroflexi bacterium]|nr:aminotransferase class I/II-fold pyridoxal phosphate-dependent enzyme [Chloroflexota bacterium]
MNYPLIPQALHPLGPNPILARIWREADLSAYPDPHYQRTRDALAAYHGVDPACVVLGVGASELLHRIVRAFVVPGDRVLSLGAPFGEFARAVALQRGNLQVLDRHSLATISPARLLYLSNPHSPTGHLLPPMDWPQMDVVVVDEAYAPFLAEQIMWPLRTNVIRVQSPGKAHGLLGLRPAYALAAPALATQLVNLQPAWALPAPLAEVLAALPSADDFLRETLGKVRSWADELAMALDTPSTGLHFFTLHRPNARQVTAALLAQGIRVRDCTSFGLPDFIRIATRRREDNHKLVEILARMR